MAELTGGSAGIQLEKKAFASSLFYLWLFIHLGLYVTVTVRIYWKLDCRPRFARLAASPLPRAYIALTKSEEKERLFAVYDPKVRAASLRYRNRAVITVLMCEQRLYLRLSGNKYNFILRPTFEKRMKSPPQTNVPTQPVELTQPKMVNKRPRRQFKHPR